MIDAIHLIKEKYYHARDLLLVIIIIVQLKNVHFFYIRCSSNRLIVKKKQTMETLCLSITQYVMLRNKRQSFTDRSAMVKAETLSIVVQ